MPAAPRLTNGFYYSTPQEWLQWTTLGGAQRTFQRTRYCSTGTAYARKRELVLIPFHPEVPPVLARRLTKRDS